MTVSRERCRELAVSLSLEWLETNGLGGFACGTVAGAHTRRYHGLLTAALTPPTGRVLLLSRLEEALLLGSRHVELSTNVYTGAVHPEGYRWLESFRPEPFPTWTFRVGSLEVEKTLFLRHGEDTLVVEYRLRGAGPEAALEVRPLLAFRDYHALTRRNDALDRCVASAPGRATVTPYPKLPPLHFAHNAAELLPEGFWYYDFHYPVERERGFEYTEDLFSPFVLRYQGPGPAVLVTSTHPRTAEDASPLRAAEASRRAAVAARAPAAGELARRLTLAADQFLVRRGSGRSVIAGYPWFSDWGRDTMIALPGLTLATGQPEAAREILLAFAAHVDQGMIPNRFPDRGEAPEYNNVDGTLWFFAAVAALHRRGGEGEFLRAHLYPVLAEIVEWHVRGTRYGIRVDADGLLRAGAPGQQLTWMDARIDGWVVTPRRGKPVEVQALWHHALRLMERLSAEFGDAPAAARYRRLADTARRSFRARFWNPERGCLFDGVDGDEPAPQDPAVRPNQLLAVSLPEALLPAAQARQVVEVCRRELLTPRGLRTLSPREPGYEPCYGGDAWHRDAAYHQGTVWPWLMGPFLTAYLRVHRGSRSARDQAWEWLAGFAEHLDEAGLGQVSEIFDAEPPYLPNGCFAQAWSVAELLRVLADELPG